jgi:hypothetical protein
MGMFDYLYDSTLRCPYCGGLDIELQTKDYDCVLETIDIHIPGNKKCSACTWPINIKKGERPHPLTNLRSVSAIGSCDSPRCMALSRMRQFVLNGYISGFGRTFDVKYNTDKDGIAIAPAIITQKDNDTLEQIHKHFVKMLSQDKRAKKDFDVVLKRSAGDWGLAVLEWRYFPPVKLKRETV